MGDLDITELKEAARKIRVDIIKMTAAAGSGHPGGSLSSAEILTALYFKVLEHNPKKIDWDGRDRFVLSKGHACPVLYAALANAGYFPKKELMTLRKINTRLQGHPHFHSVPGVENTAGPLGQGISFAVGVALGAKRLKKKFKVYVAMGDGEINEGQAWEAFMFAAKYKLDNLIGIVDRNYIQIDGNTEDVLRLESVRERWSSFGWNVIEIDGHDIQQIIDALHEADEHENQPTMIILSTVKGKGVSFMENNVDFHGVPPNELEYKLAIRELDTLQRKLEGI